MLLKVRRGPKSAEDGSSAARARRASSESVPRRDVVSRQGSRAGVELADMDGLSPSAVATSLLQVGISKKDKSDLRPLDAVGDRLRAIRYEMLF